jgi:formamidopyrimidine-DNA glycosylase
MPRFAPVFAKQVGGERCGTVSNERPMPELPEVETVARGLRRTIPGRRILSVWLGKTDFIDDPAAVEQHLPGRRIESVERYGKFMLLRLSAAIADQGETSNRGTAEGESALLVHLGMTGQLAPSAAEQPQEKHTHVRMQLDDGRELRYTDARRFGRVAYLGAGALAEELKLFGADPLEVTAQEFAQRVRSRKARIKALLLDQSVLRGVGNIYADESLWSAKIHPSRLGSSLSVESAELLRRKLRKILQRAIAMRGSSISDFLDADGEAGEYQRHHRAYGREGRACYRCKTPIRRAIIAGRSSHFCPKCQPAPRIRGGKRGAKKRSKKKRAAL